jgi:hypothetical protein
MAQWFFIQNGRGAGAPAWGGSTSLGQTEAAGDGVIVTRDGPLTNGRFRFGPRDREGRFVIYTPTGRFVVTVDADGDVILGHPSPGDARQLWRWREGGQLINGKTGRVAAFRETSQGTKLSTNAPVDGDPTQVWIIVAAGPPDDSPFSLYNSVADSGNYQVASIYTQYLRPGVPVYLETQTPLTHGQLWFYTSNGTIYCAEDPNLLLTATTTGAVFVAAPLCAPANPTFQQWILQQWILQQWIVAGNSGYVIFNVETLQVLTAAAPAAPLQTQPFTNPPPANQTWNWTPGYPLTTILNQPPVGFPQFTGDQLTAYNYINEQLGLTADGTNIRAEYPNLGAPLTIWASTIGEYQCPSDVLAADWTAVTQQLITELTYAASVQNLFTLYSTAHTQAFDTSSGSLTSIGTDISVSTSTSVSGTGTALLEGVLYTATCALPESSVFINIFYSLFTAALAANTISPSPFQVAYSALQKQLVPGFEEVLDTLDAQQATILEDWGMMNTVANLILQPSGPNSLAWPTESSAAYVTAATQGYSLAAVQMLLPTQFWVSRFGGQPTITDGAPAGSYWGYQDYYANVNCVVAQSGSKSNYPSSNVLNDVSNNGGRVADFYPARAGWNVTVVDGQIDRVAETSSAFGNWQYDTLLATIVNMSERPLSVALKAEDGSVEVIGNTTLSMSPYGFLDFAVDHDDAGLSINVTVTDQETGAGEAFFKLHLEIQDPFFTPPAVENIWVDSQSSSNGFAIGTPVIQQWATPDLTTSSSFYTCGSVTVPVFYIPPG